MAQVSNQYRDPFPEPSLPRALTNLKELNQAAYFDALIKIKDTGRIAFNILNKPAQAGVHHEADALQARMMACSRLNEAFAYADQLHKQTVLKANSTAAESSNQISLKVDHLETFILHARITMQSLSDNLEMTGQKILSFFTKPPTIAPVTDQDFFDAYIAQLENTARKCNHALSILKSSPPQAESLEPPLITADAHKAYTAIRARNLLAGGSPAQ